MSGQVIVNPVFTPLDNSGNVVVGGKLYAYASGTTTPQNTYTDSGLGTPNANPVVMDSAGRATIFLDPSLGYKFVFKTAADSTLWTVDDVALPISSGSITLAMMANLAQDKFIGRVTASTGVPETATITAAARTVLDDTTVGAMVDTLGGAAASGTGGLARINAPAFTAVPTFTPGTGNASASLTGVININTTAVGNVGAGADTLMTYTLPANTLAANGRGIRIYSSGITGANANTKQFIQYFGSVPVAGLISAAVALNLSSWVMETTLIRVNASSAKIYSRTLVGAIATTTSTFVYNVSGSGGTGGLDFTVTNEIKVTGESVSVPASDDVIQDGMIVEVF